MNMHSKLPIFCGTFALFLWLLASGYLRAAFGAYAYNESWLLVLAFAIAVLIATIAVKPLHEFRARYGITLAALDVAAGFGCIMVSEAAFELSFLCLHVICDTILIYEWMVVLGRIGFAKRAGTVCASALAAMVLIAIGWNSAFPLAMVLAVLCPALLGIAFMLLPDDDGRAASREHPQRDDREAEAERDLIRMLILPGACLICASFFVGIEATFVTNSYIIHRDGLIVVILCVALIGGIAALIELRGSDAAEDRFGGGSLQQRYSMFALASGTLLTIVLIFGLTLFSLQFAATFMFAIAFAMGVQAGSVVVLWITLPYSIGSERSRIGTAIALILGIGIAWATDLGISFIKLIDLSYRTTLNVSTVLIAIIVIAIALAIAIHLNERYHDAKAASAALPIPSDGAEEADLDDQETPGDGEIPLENVYAALRNHQKRLLEPYDLTKREEQIAMLLLDGQPVSSIAEQLVISERTVKFHSTHIYKKTKTSNKKELVAKFTRADDLAESEELVPNP